MRDFEKFLKDHKEYLESKEPSDFVWQRIDSNLNRKGRGIFKIAAAVFFIAILSGFIGFYIASIKETVFSKKIASIYPDYPETEKYLIAQFELKYPQLKKSILLETIKKDLDQIDIEIASLKSELISAPYSIQEEIISNLIKAYQSKLELLDIIIQQSTKSKNHENPSII
jgi:hypothetical protein